MNTTESNFYRQFLKELDSEELTFNHYQHLASRTINNNLTNEGKLFHSLFGMVSEVGELHGIFQKEYQEHKRSKEHMMKEVGDLLWFIAEFCTVNGWELSEVAAMNIQKLKERYPEGFEPERSLHRKEGDL